MKTENIHVGDFVYCRSKYYRSQLQLPEELGLVIEIKRSNFKVLYASDKRCWIPRDVITIVQPELDYSTLLQRLHFLLRRLDADDCEIVTIDGKYRLSARIDRIDHTTIDEIRTFLGPDFISFTIVPEGMAFMVMELIFATP